MYWKVSETFKLKNGTLLLELHACRDVSKMNANRKDRIFDFVLESWDVQCYRRRDSLLRELKSIPETEVSDIGTAAANTGWELVVVTVVSMVANILTIANILHKHLRKTEKPQKTGPIAYVFIDNRKIVLNNMSKEEIAELIESGRSSAQR